MQIGFDLSGRFGFFFIPSSMKWVKEKRIANLFYGLKNAYRYNQLNQVSEVPIMTLMFHSHFWRFVMYLKYMSGANV